MKGKIFPRESIAFKVSVPLVLTLIGSLQAKNYYVSPSGSDGGPGTLTQPFQTIQQAASIMAAGDTAYIRAGVYRETVAPKNSGTQSAPITFMPYNGESVTVSGADVIPSSSWTVSSGSIYKAPMNWDLGDGANQVFLDGQAMIEARWPNTSLDVSHPPVAHTANGWFVNGGRGLWAGSISDPQLPSRPAGYWNGATINMCLGPCWIWQAGQVIDSSVTGNLSFTFANQGHSLVPGAGNAYYLTGKLTELDAPAEWFRDKDTSTLFFWTPASDSPALHVVEAKHRRLAFDLSGRSFVIIQGIGIFAATIDSDSRTQYVVLDALQCQYISNDPLPVNQGSYYAGGDRGIALRGSNNVIRNSTIAFSSGSGVYLEGMGQHVLNNVIRDIDYRPTYSSPVFAGSGQTQQNQHLIAYNTIYNSARFGIYHAQQFGTGRILYNEIHDYGLQTNDLGCTYTWGTNGMGTEIAYNLCHDGKGLLLPNQDQVYVAGIYLDDNSSNFLVHHNVVWNSQFGAELKGTGHKIFNNTFVGAGSSFTPYGDDNMTGTVIENNIFVAPIRANPIGAMMSNNILPGTNPQFVDPANHNFQLQRGSPAIAGGLVIPPYTVGYSGPAPDIGAYDHTKPAWNAGAQAAAYTLDAASYRPSLAPGSAAVVFGTVPFDSGASVLVTDGAGADLLATMLYSVASPPQLAFAVPSNAVPGVGMITITNSDGTVSLSSAPIFPVAPSLFSADASGSGLAAAQVLRVTANGTHTYSLATNYDSALGTWVPAPIDLSSPTDQVYLILYGTGIRGRRSLDGVTVNVGGVNTQVSYAGAQGQYPGLDQVNLLLPNSLAGKGTVNIVLTVDGQSANVVTVSLK